MTYLVTGSAGFIGFHTAKKLLEAGNFVIGVDNFNEYYDIEIKEDRNKILEEDKNFKLLRGNIADLDFVKGVFEKNKIDIVCHLAAQAGVRYSIENPYAYIDSNIVGFMNILNETKNAGIKDFVFASSSSVYGEQKETPFSEDLDTDKTISLYAATKKSNELMAYTYHHLFGMNCTGLRFFTVYGPWGRPDMAIFSFTKDILENRVIKVFNDGEMFRDFTFVDDIISGILKACEKKYPFEIINLGNNNPVKLIEMIDSLEKELNKKAQKDFLPVQAGDVLNTCADLSKAKEKLQWEPRVKLAEGLKRFVDWYKNYYKID